MSKFLKCSVNERFSQSPGSTAAPKKWTCWTINLQYHKQ